MEKSFWIFQNGGFFKIANIFWQINVFANISWFFHQIWKILVATGSWVQKDLNRFFVAQAVPEIYGKNERLKNRGDVFFLLSTVIRFMLLCSCLAGRPNKKINFLLKDTASGTFLKSFWALNGVLLEIALKISKIHDFKSEIFLLEDCP